MSPTPKDAPPGSEEEPAKYVRSPQLVIAVVLVTVMLVGFALLFLLARP